MTSKRTATPSADPLLRFYKEIGSLAGETSLKLSSEQEVQVKRDLEISTEGEAVPAPVVSFAYLELEDAMRQKIVDSGFEAPTSIQAIAVPCGLAGRDFLGISQTGSGKTLAYLLPLILHVKAKASPRQRRPRRKEGPVACIIVPTRELCMQVFREAKRFGKVYALKTVAVYGGVPKHEQWKALNSAVDIVVATPGRLLDLVNLKATSLGSVSFVVLDEADAMFSRGFEFQCRQLLSLPSKPAQVLLFSATFRPKLHKFVREFLKNPVKAVVGREGQTAEEVQQCFVVLRTADDKAAWLSKAYAVQHLSELTDQGSVLIFVNKRETAESLSSSLNDSGQSVACLHGQMEQSERTATTGRLKREELKVLVTTDVASRGLDIPVIRSVVNYECPDSTDTYTHRVGRTGRKDTGTAYTLLTSTDRKFACQLVLFLDYNELEVPADLEHLARQDSNYRKLASKNALYRPQ
jgi:ATP-dependent RNA helicase DDX42